MQRAIVRCSGKEYPGAHEPLIDQEIWDTVQAIRARRATVRGGKVTTRGTGGLLSEFAYCAKCDSPMHWYVSGGGLYYYCSRRRKFGKSACDQAMIPAEKIEPAALNFLRSLSLPPDAADRVIFEVQRRIATPHKVKTINAAKVREQIRRLKVSWRAGDEDLDEKTYFSELRLLEELLADVPPVSERVFDVQEAMRLLGNMSSLLDQTNPEQQRALMQQIVRQVWMGRSPKRNGDAWIKAIAPTGTYAALVSAIVSSSKFALVTSAGVEPTTFSFGG